MTKYKKGLLLGEKTVKIIIAVICIVFLASLLYSVYLLVTKGDEDLEHAEASLKRLQKELNAGASEIEIYNPSGFWAITSFSQEKMPKTCSNAGWNACICICNDETPTAVGGRRTWEEQCDAKGRCIENDFVIAENLNSVVIANPPLILAIDYETKQITQEK